ncbi:S1 RNA-binding domain-containing protein [Candidatus Pacearchaeota archaeon]|nr:S1 RNA-binding domain-containing protein [Candidatus Pacearchaeota archaeon]
MTDRITVIPGEIIAENTDALPGENTIKEDGKIIAQKYGLADISDKLIKVIPLSGTYLPRRGNIVIGEVQEITFNGWIINFSGPDTGFLSLMEVPMYVNKDGLDEVMKIGDMVTAKIWNINRRGTDLSIKSRGLGKIEGGLIVTINQNKVPRVIGKEGSMVNLIKENTGCQLTVGQNGLVHIKGDSIEKELFAKEAILFVEKNSASNGLTENITKWFEENKK